MAGRRRSIVWSPEAEADLVDIWNYYVEVAGQKVADTIVRAIGEACRMLEELRLRAVRATKSGQDFARCSPAPT
jgi:plasmid stabilization system protein ParE